MAEDREEVMGHTIEIRTVDVSSSSMLASGSYPMKMSSSTLSSSIEKIELDEVRPPSSSMEDNGSNSVDFGTLEELLGSPLHFKKKEILGQVPNQCSIYRVPTNLRKIKPEAYTPQVISIGPLHYDNDELREMEIYKLRCVSEFCKRFGKETLIGFKKFIKENEGKIRNCYAEYSYYESLNFVNLILRDSVFVVEFILKFYKPGTKGETKRDYFVRTPCVVGAIVRDLLLLENQLPYFVLEDLYERMLSCSTDDLPKKFPNLCYELFYCTILSRVLNKLGPKSYEIRATKLETDRDEILEEPRTPTVPQVSKNPQHLIDLGRLFFVLDHCRNGNEEQSESVDIPCPTRLHGSCTNGNEEQNESVDIPCATRLHGSGVKFSEGVGSLTNIRFKDVDRKMLSVSWFKELNLQVPTLKVDDMTEYWIRNMMALEMCHYPQEHHVCNYIALMNDLIEDKRDVDLLFDSGIIVHNIEDNAALANMFNNLCLQIAVAGKDSYSGVRKTLKQHYKNRWNHLKAKLKTTYFSDLWKGTATVAAITLLLLTFIQTMCSLLPLLRG